MHRAKPGSDTKETINVDTTITLDRRPRHVSGHSFGLQEPSACGPTVDAGLGLPSQALAIVASADLAR